VQWTSRQKTSGLAAVDSDFECSIHKPSLLLAFEVGKALQWVLYEPVQVHHVEVSRALSLGSVDALLDSCEMANL
jgi:hypothetical protein